MRPFTLQPVRRLLYAPLLLFVTCALLLSVGCTTERQSQSSTSPGTTEQVDTVRILVFSVTAGYRHRVIPYGNEQIAQMSERIKELTGARHVEVDIIDDEDGDASAFPSDFETLSRYHTIVWNSTTGSPLNEAQQAAFKAYIQAGGGYAGIHAASDTHYDWPWYGDLVGAYFDGHPDRQEGELNVTDRSHPSTRHMPARYRLYDEFYDFHRNPRGHVHVLMTINEDSYEGAGMEGGRVDHPMAWSHYYDGGRAWFTALGHTQQAWEDEYFLEHVLQGILWAGGLVEGDSEATVWDSYEQVTVTQDISEPMSMSVAPDGRIFLIQRTGEILVTNTEQTDIALALKLDVHYAREDGGLGIVVDPNFAENGWVYVYYSPELEAAPHAQQGHGHHGSAQAEDIKDEMPYNRLSRFVVTGDTLDPASEVEILRVHHTREGGRHSGGDLQFGPDGALWLSTGDDIGGPGIDGYTPTYDQDFETKTATDARGTAANTADLRGKMIRIFPHEDGSYSIPEDNLFTVERGYGDEIEAGLVRPEIFLMGARNPFRFGVDSETGWLYYADYGPDATEWSPERGPIGIREYNQVREAGNAGWPMVRGPQLAYPDYDWAQRKPIALFDPDNPINDSPFNTGLRELPPVQPATLYVPRHGLWDVFVNPPKDHPWGDAWDVPEKPPFPQLTNSAPNGGPMYRHKATHAPTALPEAFDGKWFIGEWSGGRLLMVSFDEQGDFLEIEPFFPPLDIHRPHDIEIGPDGHLYVLDYGASWSGRDNPGIYRIDYLPRGQGVLALDWELDNSVMAPGSSTRLRARLDTRFEQTVRDIEVSVLGQRDGLRVEAQGELARARLGAGESYDIVWDIAVDADAFGGEQTLILRVKYLDRSGQIRWLSQQLTLTVDGPVEVPFGFNLGGNEAVEIQGLTFQPWPHIAVQSLSDEPESERYSGDIEGAGRPLRDLYQTAHVGRDLGYRVALANGTYDLRLHFSEVSEDAQGANARIFDVRVQGERVLTDFEIAAERDFAQMLTVTLNGVEVVDGYLRLETESKGNRTLLSGFEVRESIERLPSDLSLAADEAFDPAQTIRIKGDMGGWTGIAPESIKGVRNPTLVLTEGETYTLEWLNADGVYHNFAVASDGLQSFFFVSSGTTGVEAAETVEFTAESGMGVYLCTPHPEDMLGQIRVVEAEGD
ncbi:ThuA domain-containing protein [Marinimicrobium alkaliphilum]|uniref:ThuA domain-containing protein n=1 Tax=Marinimicrobium alkaliphilum TaxID=2202654 RepID=UPI000DB9FF84|nr:ThuA domain-containing protein [Marinimicrobium alkaliphilum]